MWVHRKIAFVGFCILLVSRGFATSGDVVGDLLPMVNCSVSFGASTGAPLGGFLVSVGLCGSLFFSLKNTVFDLTVWLCLPPTFSDLRQNFLYMTEVKSEAPQISVQQDVLNTNISVIYDTGETEAIVWTTSIYNTSLAK